MMGQGESVLLETQLALDVILPSQRKSHVCCEIPLLIFLNPPPSLKDLGKKQFKNALSFAVTPLCLVPTMVLLPH